VTAEGLFLFFAAVLGAIVGSFANVCIHRLPKGESVVTPPSRCPRCGERIAARDNIPILSFLLLRGRCRRCRSPIAVRYPLVEGATSLLFLLAAVLWGPSLDALRGGLLGAACVILVGTDLAERILPDEVTLGGTALGASLSLVEDLTRGGPFSLAGSRFVGSLLGAAVGGGLLLAVRAAYLRLRRVEGLGLGDVKMLAMIGAFTGPAGALLSVFAGSISGSVVGLSAAALRRAAWWREAQRAARDPDEAANAARRHGLLVGPRGEVLAAGPPWSDIPGAAADGELLRASSRVARPVVAVARLARRRAGSKGPVRSGRIVVDDGDCFFRVYAVLGLRVGENCLVLLDRADVPFGVFLALGAVVTLLAARPLLLLAGFGVFPPAGLLP
jgi:leader peptidase (prepilin peptidase)/N-methyltransferase